MLSMITAPLEKVSSSACNNFNPKEISAKTAQVTP